MKNQIKSVFESALSKGTLVHTENTIHIIQEADIHFQVRLAPSLSKKKKSASAAVAIVAEPSSSQQEEHNHQVVQSKKPTFNPFLPYDPDLYVDSYEHHHILLNKYSIVKEHVLLTTKTYKDQFDLLEPTDFEAAFKFMNENPQYFCFYNGGPFSGASIPHRHLQFLPLEQSEQIPIQKIINELRLKMDIGQKQISQSNGTSMEEKTQMNSRNKEMLGKFYRLPCFPFVHGLLMLHPHLHSNISTGSEATSTIKTANLSEIIHENYIRLLDDVLGELGKSHLDVSIKHVNNASGKKQTQEDDVLSLKDKLVSYNLVLTLDWLLIVPRRKEFVTDSFFNDDSISNNHTENNNTIQISVNSVSMAGYLLAKSQSEFDYLKTKGPLSILQQLTFSLKC